MSKSRPLLLFGGSFDPVHGGHLRTASYFARRGYDVLLLPAGSPRWKKTESSGEMRLLLLRLALASLGEEGIEIDPRELHREGESRTIDTVLEIREENPGRELALLLGADQALRFPEWREAERLSSLAKVLYIPRDGIEVPGDIKERFHMEEIPYKGAGLVSSTSIREIHSLDLPGQELVAIEGHRLYLWGKIAERMGEGRYEHSLSVAHLCREIASYNRLGERMELLAYRAGLLHDLGKDLREEEEGRLLEGERIPEGMPGYSLHQWTGAKLARELGEEDEDVLDAIRVHCTGDSGMSPLAKILYAADKIDPGRGWDSRNYVRAMMRDYEEGFREVLRANREYLKEHGGEKNPMSERAYLAYLGKEGE